MGAIINKNCPKENIYSLLFFNTYMTINIRYQIEVSIKETQLRIFLFLNKAFYNNKLINMDSDNENEGF